jgi:transcriptional regulator with XRE-family HTH domain
MQRRHPVFDLLQARGQTQRWLAVQLDMSYHTIRAVRYGKRKPGTILRARAANFFGLPESLLFYTQGGDADDHKANKVAVKEVC